MSKLVHKGSKFTDEDRRMAVVEYSITGNDQAVSDKTGICRQTINRWRLHSDWWDELVGEVRQQISEGILAKNLQIATKASELVLDSLENGDEKLVWDKDKGKHVIKRVKPSAKDAAVISGITQDKARVQMSLPTSITDNGNSMEHIRKLAEHFAELSRASYEEKKINSIPGESKEVE